ncbi:MAG: terminase family protein [Nanoarchaeota archaeon]|nr:terminase family protein [Nanoarchaeota archaeon]
MKYDILRPWRTLDPWQKDYCFDPVDSDNFLLTGRQVGKTTGMSIRSVELCMNHFKKGEFVLINSITEKQAYHMLAKSLVYATEKYSKQVIWKGDNKPTKHRLMFKNGTGILCYAAGETGEGLRGYTIKKIMSDEGSRMSEEYFIATLPALSIVGGTLDIASTPFGKKHKDGSEKFFYKCSKDDSFKKYFVNGEDCPRHTPDFLLKAKNRLSKLAYSQEFLAVFTDELKRLFSDEMIERICVLKRPIGVSPHRHYLGCDIAGFGEDECTYEAFKKVGKEIIQVESIAENRNLTTDTSKKIKTLDMIYNFKKIGIDDGGVGFGVWSELMDDNKTKRKTVALNNSARITDWDGKKHKKILKEEMYMNLQVLMEQNRIKLLDDREIKASLASMQHDDGRIFGSNSHHAEGIDRGVWLAEKDKALNIYVY